MPHPSPSASVIADPSLRIKLGPAPRVLVVKAAGIGDLLLAVPALRSLRAEYPDARVDLLTTPGAAQLLRDSKLIDQILVVNKFAFDYPLDVLRAPWRLARLLALGVRLRAQRYDAVLLMHHLTLPFGRVKYRTLLWATGAPLRVGLDNGHGGFLNVRVQDAGFGARHEAQYMMDLVAAFGASPPPVWHGASLADLGWHGEDGLTSETGAPVSRAPLVALHAGSGTYSLARRWPEYQWAELARALHDEFAASIVLVGGPDERAETEQLAARLGNPQWVRRFLAEQGVRALADVLANCDLVIGNDSLPVHLAAAAGTPVVAIFGPSNHRAWAPLAVAGDAFVTVVRQDLSCSPCFYVGHGLGTPQGCAARTCLTTLQPSAVLIQARAALAMPRAKAARPDAGSAA